MRNATKRLISLLTALVMACSLIAVPAAADAETKNPPEAGDSGAVNPPEEEEDSLTPDADASSGDTDELSGDTGAAEDTSAAGGAPAPAAEEADAAGGESTENAIVDLQGLYGYSTVRMAMYANDPRNTESGLKNLETTLKGIVRGTEEEVEVTVKWTRIDNNPFNPKGYSGTGSWLIYSFESKELSVEDHPDYKISRDSLLMNLMVVAVTGAPVFKNTSHSVDRTTVLNWETNHDHWESELNLPTEVEIVYKPIVSHNPAISEWIQWADEFQPETHTTTIDSWYMTNYSAELTGWEQLWNAVRGGDTSLTLWPRFNNGNSAIPKWAYYVSPIEENSELKLNFSPSTKATVTFTSQPTDITYGQPLTAPMAKASVDGNDINATFVYLYQKSMSGTISDYWSGESQTPPTDVGKYKVTARLYSPNDYEGTAEAEFEISKASAVTTEAYFEANPNGGTIDLNVSDPQFLPSSMSVGVSLAGQIQIPSDSFITGSQVYAAGSYGGISKIELTTKAAAPGTSTTFTVPLSCNNYASLTVKVTVAVPEENTAINVTGVKTSGSEFAPNTALKDIVDLTSCTATVGGDTANKVELALPDTRYVAPGDYNQTPVLLKITCAGKVYQAYGEISFTIRALGSVPETTVAVTVAGKTYDGTPVTATATAASVTSPAFYITYEGINGTEYPINTIAPTDAGTYRVTANLITPGYSGSATEEFTISKVTKRVEATAYVSVPNGDIKTVKIDETFISSNMAKGAKIMVAPTINKHTLIESCAATAGSNQLILKSKSDAPNGSSQNFILMLTSDNYQEIRVTVIVQNDTVAITGAKLKDGKTEFPSGTALKAIVDLSGCTATINGSTAAGTFALMDPDKTLTEPNEYKDWSVTVEFTTTEGKTYQVKVSVPDFTVKEEGGDGGEDLDAGYLKNGYFIVLYANHSSNTSAEGLLKLVQDTKKSYTIGGTEYPATWSADSGNPRFEQKGYTENVWYSYTATVNGKTAKAHVRVLPVKAVPALGNKTLKATDIETLADENAMKTLLDLPGSADVSYTADTTGFNEKDITGDKPTSGKWTITGWQLDGKALTLAALKAKAASATSLDVTVELTPICDVPDWANVQGSAPTFKLTITPKTPVKVTWNTPQSFVYGTTLGELLELGKSDPQKGCDEPVQTAIGDGGTDSNGTWQYFYYNSDGTKLSSEPKDAGTYKVQAVLVSSTHSGASELKEFTINPRSIDGEGFTFTPPTGMDLTYNKQPQTPMYTVKDGDKTLTKGTDYTVDYDDNTNAGTAKVTFTGIGNYTEEKEETFTIKQLALTETQKPTITGNAEAGQVLSALLDGVDAKELEWVWMVGGNEVSNYTALGYTVRPEDSNKEITVQAKAKDGGNYSGTSAVSDGTTVAKVTVTGTVTVTAAKTGWDGKITVGTELTADAGVTPDGAKGGGTWSWKVNGAVKENVTDETYTVAEGDEEIVAVFTPSSDYAGTIQSSVIEVGKAPLTGTVTIGQTGVAVGDMLMATVTGSPKDAMLTYTWLRDGTPIDGASGQTYTVVKEDRGKTISVKVTAEDYTGEIVSDGTDIPAVKPGAPTIEITNEGDKTLTFKWSVTDDGGTPVTGYKLKVVQASYTALEATVAASTTTYTLDQGLVNGAPCTVTVIAVNSAGEGGAGTAKGTPTAPPTPPTPGGGGGGGGSGGGGGWSGGGGGKPSTGDPSNPDDKKTVVETLEDGTVVTTVTDSQGYVARTEERPDGSILSTVHHVDGCNGTIETDTSGKTIAVADVPANVARAAVDGDPVLLPVVGIRAHKDIDKAPALVVNTFGVNGVKVRIPVENKGITVVAVEIKSDGTPVIVKNTIPTEDGIILRMDHLEVIRFLDNRKNFADTQGHWAADAIDFVSARELFNGTAPDAFSPDAGMTRAMLVTVLARYAGADTAGGAAWYEKGAAWATANGLSDGTRLYDHITREQLVTILYRYAILKGKAGDGDASLSDYADADSISDWAVDAMSWAVEVGLIKGTTSTTLNPQSSATRAQVAVVIMRYVEMFGL